MPKFRTITGQFVGYIPDSIDSDIVPDRAPMNGRVTFTPVFTGGVIAFPELSPPEFAHPRTINARIVDGFVQVEVNEGEGDDEQIVLQPLTLMVTVDDEASQVWSWRAEFDEILIGASDEYVKIPAWSFRVPDGTGPVDLTELVPLKTGGSVDVTKGPRGAGLQNITAVDGQLVFAYTDGEEATIAIPEAVQGPQGEPGPAGADGEQGPEGPQGPAGEIPDLLVSNISDATPTGKNLMLAATEGAARNALGLQAGATAANGSLTELETGTSSNPRVWTPSNLAEYVGEQVSGAVDGVQGDISERLAPIVSTGIASNDLNLIDKTGFYQTDAETLNKPSGLAYMSVIHISSLASRWQMAMPSRSASDGRQQVYTRLGTATEWTPWEHFLSDRDLNASIVPQMVGEAQDSASDLYSAILAAAGNASTTSSIYVSAGQMSPINSTFETIENSGLATRASVANMGASGTGLVQTWVTIPNGWVQADLYFLWLHTEATLQSGGVTFRGTTGLPQSGQAWGSSFGTFSATDTVSEMQAYVIRESKVASSRPVSNDQPLFVHAGRSGAGTEDTFPSSVKLLGIKLVRVL